VTLGLVPADTSCSTCPTTTQGARNTERDLPERLS